MTLERLAIYQSSQDDYLRGMFRYIISKPLGQKRIDDLVATARRTPPAIGTAMLIADLYGKDRSRALAKVKVPVLVIAAGTSPELEAQRAMAASIPGARFQVIEDASHAVFLDQPEKFRRVLGAFLENIH
jgi:microsomal epoxide hydrolase